MTQWDSALNLESEDSWFKSHWPNLSSVSTQPCYEAAGGLQAELALVSDIVGRA